MPDQINRTNSYLCKSYHYLFGHHLINDLSIAVRFYKDFCHKFDNLFFLPKNHILKILLAQNKSK